MSTHQRCREQPVEESWPEFVLKEPGKEVAPSARNMGLPTNSSSQQTMEATGPIIGKTENASAMLGS